MHLIRRFTRVTLRIAPMNTVKAIHILPALCRSHLPRPEWTTAGRSIRQRRIVALLIVSNEAWRCSEGAYKIREASLSAKEGSGSGCALPHRPPCLWRRPVLPSRKPGVLGCSFGRLGTSSPRDVLTSTPQVRAPVVARWHDHLHDLATASRASCGLAG